MRGKVGLKLDLKDKSMELIKHFDILKVQYLNNEAPEDKKSKEFFARVKQETTPIYRLIGEWGEEARIFVQQREVNVHPQQVVSTSENMELLLMHSYYIDVKRKRYMELNHSVHFVMDQLIADIDKLR